MISQTIARRYAQALLALGQEDGKYAEYGKELAEFAELVETTGLADALTNPLYPEDARRKVLDAVLAKAGLSKIMRNFMMLLQDKGRMNHVSAICDYYRRLVDEVNNVKRATITTATAVSEAVQKKVKKTLEEMTGKTIILEAVEDPEIIGGMIAQVGDLTLDGSVKTQLKNLKESLIKG